MGENESLLKLSVSFANRSGFPFKRAFLLNFNKRSFLSHIILLSVSQHQEKRKEEGRSEHHFPLQLRLEKNALDACVQSAAERALGDKFPFVGCTDGDRAEPAHTGPGQG